MLRSDRTNIAIVGAGIAGLSLAVALNALDHERKIAIDIYESAPELSEIGAGINVWPRTWKIFERIGLGDTLAPLFDHYPNLEPRIIYEIRKADQRNGFKITDIVKDGGRLRIHRAELQKCLVACLPLDDSPRKKTVNSSCTIHLSHRLVDYAYQLRGSTREHLNLYFSNKPPKACDILIGADGIKSSVRQLFLNRLPNPEIYQKCLLPRWSTAVAYRGLVEKEVLRKLTPDHRVLDHPGIMYVGKHKHAVAYSISGGRFINVVATAHEKPKGGATYEGQWNSEVSREELLRQFTGWDDEFQRIIQCIERPTKWALHDIHPPDTFASGRVILIGDSAHAMLPYQGAGAGSGVEDAYIIATLFTHPLTPRSPSSEYVAQVVDVYNRVRVPSAAAMVKATAMQGALYTLDVPELDEYKEGEDIPSDKLLEVFHAAGKNWSWTATDPEGDRRVALNLLEASSIKAKY